MRQRTWGRGLSGWGLSADRISFKEFKETLGKTGQTELARLRGPSSLGGAGGDAADDWPDNSPVKTDWNGTTLKLIPGLETANGIQKEIEVTLDPKENSVKVLHRITNHNPWEIEFAVWALSVMAPSGRAIYPQEDYRPHEEYLLPARPMVLWHYTLMGDPRWTWGTKYVQLRQDPNAKTKQKIGFLDKQGWAAYTLNGEVFIKKYDVDPKAAYPDYGCNTETFTNWDMLEIESLGPLAKVSADGGKLEHTEVWTLAKADVGTDDASIDATLLPLVKK